MRSIPVVVVALQSPRGVLVLELDTPSPLEGVGVGDKVALVYADGSKADAEFRGHGFASASPEHAHVIVSAPEREGAPVALQLGDRHPPLK